jgi:hypothetical protein
VRFEVLVTVNVKIIVLWDVSRGVNEVNNKMELTETGLEFSWLRFASTAVFL